MDRRSFLVNLSAAGVASVLDPAYLCAKEKLASGTIPSEPVPRLPYGKHDENLSIIGFGGMLVRDSTPADAASYVSEAVQRGINFFDVAPTYGNAQDRLGPALKPYRQKCFLACKTMKRDAAGAMDELETSLEKLQTDHFDLYQLHALMNADEVAQAFAPGGAMETVVKAKRDGKIRYIGFSAHSEQAALAALEAFDFDSILFPFSFPIWIKGEFGPEIHKLAMHKGTAILALKALVHQKRQKGGDPPKRRWPNTWYEPFDDLDELAFGLRFTLHLPVTSMIPPGNWDLFKMALDLAQSGALPPLNDKETKLVEQIANASEPLFSRHA